MPTKPRRRGDKIPGTIRPLPSGRWQVVLTLPGEPDPATGKMRYRQVTATRDTRADAQRAQIELADKHLDRRRGRSTDARDMTVADLLDRWLDYKRDRLADTTWHTYRGYIDRSIVPAIGTLRLDELAVDDVDHIERQLRTAGMKPATVRQVRAILRAALNWAMRRRYVDLNVAALAEPIRVEQADVPLYTPAEAARLLAEADRHEHPDTGLLVRLAAVSGARRGSVAAFRLSDVDWLAGTIKVDKSVSKIPGQDATIKGLKRNRGGPVPLGAETMDRLATHVAALHARARDAGIELADDFYLFSLHPNCQTPINPDRATAIWKTIRRRAGMPTARLKDLRHFVASYVTAEFDPNTAAERVKHASNKMTLDTYGHAVSERSRAAGEFMDRLLKGTG